MELEDWLRPPSAPILGHLDPVHTPHPTSWRYIFILSSHLGLGLPSGLFPSGFPTTFLYTPVYPSPPERYRLIIITIITIRLVLAYYLQQVTAQ